jgi:diguanylate cyclase (GGDEF)-like protein
MAIGERILIIESDKKNRADLYSACHVFDIEVHRSRTWPEALKRLKKHYYDIIIIGTKVPRKSSIDLIRELRKLSLDSCMLIVSPSKNHKHIVACLKEGAYDVIHLPIHKEWVTIKILRALERRRYYAEAQKKEHYWRLSIFDELTRIYNHRYFHDSLDREISSAKRYRYSLSLLMMDLDRFKKYNDCHGHLAGDEVLRALGSLFTRCIRDGDMVARYGGEEFAMILPHTSKKGAIVMAERLRHDIEKAKFLHSGCLPGGQLTISIGVATYPVDASTKDELIMKADKALYKAKHAGSNRVQSS